MRKGARIACLFLKQANLVYNGAPGDDGPEEACNVIVTPEGQAAHNLIGYYRRRGFVETGRTILFAHLQGSEGGGERPPVEEENPGEER